MTDPKKPEDDIPDHDPTKPRSDAKTEGEAWTDPDALSDADRTEEEAESAGTRDTAEGSDASGDDDIEGAGARDRADPVPSDPVAAELMAAEASETDGATEADGVAARGADGTEVSDATPPDLDGAPEAKPSDSPDLTAPRDAPETDETAPHDTLADPPRPDETTPGDVMAPPEPEPGRADAPTTASPAPGKVVVERRGGVIPGFVGGLIAVVGAAFAAPYVLPQQFRPVMSLEPVENRLADQDGVVAELATRMDETQAGVDAAARTEDLAALTDEVASLREEQAALIDTTSALRDELAALGTDLADRTNALEAADGQMSARIEEVERRPLADSADPEVIAALEAYGREVEELRAEVQEQTDANARLISEAALATEEARRAAEVQVAAVAEREALAERRQAMIDVQEAIENGTPFAAPLSTLSDIEVPPALSETASEGVPTLASLQAGFQDPARFALAAARREDAGDAPAERGLTFLQTQLGIRSLAPRDGGSADAILSRAEAAARQGDLQTAIEELQALPDSALAAMESWIADATARLEATQAADDLATSLATN